jgi:hypothetical protein
MAGVRIRELLEAELSAFATPIPVNPLVDGDALREAVVLGSLQLLFSSTVGFLIDLRTSLYFDEVNTAVLIFRDVSTMTVARSSTHSLQVFVVSGSDAELNPSVVKIRLGDISGGLIEISAGTAEFIVGQVEGIGDVAAELERDHLGEFLRTVPTWESLIDVTGRVMLSVEVHRSLPG